jgi:urease accessory protein
MIIREKQGNLENIAIGKRRIDLVSLEWYETEKRILHKKSASGIEIVIKSLKESLHLTQNDILYIDDELIVAVDILPCESIVVTPRNIEEAVRISYEIGNKHLPLFFFENELMIPHDAPAFRMLQASGYNVKSELRKLLHPLRTSVAPHSHNSGQSLFSKIIQLTTSSDA